MMKNQKAFTVLELLVVISIIVILTALCLPALSAARQWGNDIKAANNLRTLSIAVQTYAQESNAYPTTYSTDGLFWQSKISPQLGLPTNANIGSMRRDAHSVFNVPDSKPMSQRTGSQTSIALNHYIPGKPPAQVDSPTQIILLGEIDVADSDRFYPTDFNASPMPGFRRKNGTMAYMAFCDGHVEMLDSKALQRQPANSLSRFRLPNWPEY